VRSKPGALLQVMNRVRDLVGFAFTISAAFPNCSAAPGTSDAMTGQPSANASSGGRLSGPNKLTKTRGRVSGPRRPEECL